MSSRMSLRAQCILTLRVDAGASVAILAKISGASNMLFTRAAI
jgi:hypothetical protein